MIKSATVNESSCLDFDLFEQLVSIVASIQTDLTLGDSPAKWNNSLESRLVDELGPLVGTDLTYKDIYGAVLKIAINFGCNFNLAVEGEKSVADFVLMFKTVLSYQGWAKFYGQSTAPNSIEGILVNSPDSRRKAPLMDLPALELNSSRNSIDILCELFQYKRDFNSLRDNPANPTAWCPNRESWQDDYPLFYHTPNLQAPMNSSAVLFLSMDMDVFNSSKHKIGTEEDPLMRWVVLS